jgi:hypothetical protein
MEHVLGTHHARESLSREMPSRAWGELGHAMLRRMYQQLIDHGWPASHLGSVQLTSLITSTIEQVSHEYATHFGKGYAVLWERMKTQFAAVMLAMIDYDQREYVGQAMVPVAFEVEAGGEVSAQVPNRLPLIKIHGRVDRIDRQSHDSRIRIVDYKFSGGRSGRADEPDTLSDAIQGRRLQPPLYSLMSSLSLPSDSGKTRLSDPSIHSVEFRYIHPLNVEPLGFTTFLSSIWETPAGEQILKSIFRWVQGIRNGQFFVLPGPYCRGCHWSATCRFQHHPSWTRAYGLPLAKEFRQLRKQRANHG